MGAKPVLVPSVSQIFAPSLPIAGSQWAMTVSMVSADFLTLALVFGLSVLGRHLLTPSYQLSSYLDMFPCLALLLVAFAANGLYPGVLLHPAEEMRKTFNCISGVFVLMASTTFLWHNAQAYSRSVFLVTWAAGAPLVLFTRFLVQRLLRKQPWWGVPAVVLGAGPAAQRVVRQMQDCKLGVKIVGIVSDEPTTAWPRDLPPVLGGLSAAAEFGRLNAAQYAIVAMPQMAQTELRHVLQDYCRGFRHVLVVPDMPGLCSLGISTRELGGEVGFEFPQRLFHPGSAAVKRGIDIIVGVSALLLIAPLFLLIMIAIKSTSRGPVFYRQYRHGRDGEIFKALKFRTMVQDADGILMDYLAKRPENLLEWKRDHKLKNDPRVTKVGRWLRRLSLDELPQLLNVIAGQMTLVGPRPIVHAEIEKYGRGYDLYTRVRPGITGLWQVSGRNNTTYEERVSFDEYYVRNWSIWLDTYILIRTVKVVLTAEGAY